MPLVTKDGDPSQDRSRHRFWHWYFQSEWSRVFRKIEPSDAVLPDEMHVADECCREKFIDDTEDAPGRGDQRESQTVWKGE